MNLILIIIFLIVFATTFITGLWIASEENEINGFLLFSFFGIFLYPSKLFFKLAYKIAKKKINKIKGSLTQEEVKKLHRDLNSFKVFKLLFIKTK